VGLSRHEINTQVGALFRFRKSAAAKARIKKAPRRTAALRF
jgi:hypothetical protein